MQVTQKHEWRKNITPALCVISWICASFFSQFEHDIKLQVLFVEKAMLTLCKLIDCFLSLFLKHLMGLYMQAPC